MTVPAVTFAWWQRRKAWKLRLTRISCGIGRASLPVTVAMIAVAIFMPIAAVAQVQQGASLEGDWYRSDSNNHPNDGMRITIADRQARLTVMPPQGSSGFSVGQILWKGIGQDGELQVRGSDGNYYPGRIVLEGPDRLHIDVHHNGPGNDQSWTRAGPSIDGDWIRVDATGQKTDGMQIRVEGDRAQIRYLPPEAPRSFRTGSRIWRNIVAGGKLEVLGDDGDYRAAVVTLERPDLLRIDMGTMPPRFWARRDAVETVRAELANRGADSSSGPEAAADACLATSLLDDRLDVTWDWGLTSTDESGAATVGLEDELIGGFEGARERDNVLTQLVPAGVPDLPGAFAMIWRSKTGTRSSRHHTNLTSDEYHERWESYMDAGYRPSDIEVYTTPTGTRYAGIWVSNDEGIGWWSQRNMTGDQYGQSFRDRRAEGYRLIDMEAYQTSSGLRYAAIWYRSCDDANWRQVRDMNRDSYDQRVDSLSALGFRVVDFESYRTSAGQRYAAIWEKVDGPRAWAVRSDRNLKWFLNYHRQYVDEGLRLIDYEAYETANGIRYAGVWVENEPRYRFAFKSILDDSIAQYRATHGVPGISVAVIRNGDVVYRRGFGWADSAGAKAAHAGTIYLTASVSKVIGATLAARLEEQGRVDLSKPTRDFLPTLPDEHDHTVEQLLSKTGCIWHYDEGPEPSYRYYRFRGEALASVWFTDPLPRCTPGEDYHYSTLGYTYVGAVLEAQLDKDIAQILIDELSRPFALTSLRAMTLGRNAALAAAGDFAALEAPDYDLSRAYDLANGRSAPVAYEFNSWKILGGGIQANAVDLALFGWLTLDGTIVSDSVRDNRLWKSLTDSAVVWDTTTSAPRVGLAWRLSGSASNSNRVASHGGTAKGARAHLRVYPDDDLVVAILSNQRDSALLSTSSDRHPHPVTALAMQVRRIALDNSP